jgi:Tol biopolymer transport system component
MPFLGTSPWMGGNAGTGGGGGTDPAGAYSIGGIYAALPRCQSGPDNSSFIAFDSDREDFDREIYLVHPDGSELTRVTTRAGVDQEPSFSSDGQQLSFTSDRDGSLQIYVLDLAGGDARQLTHRSEGADQSSFSHDGRLVAFHSGASTYTISIDGTDERVVATGPDPFNGYAWPQFTADDAHLIVDRSNEIDVTALDGSGMRSIVQNSTTTIESPAISPNGVDVAYHVRCNFEDALSIWSSPFALTTGPCAGARITPLGEPHSEHPSWGPADRIAYSRVDDRQNVGQIAIISRKRGSTACAVTTDDSDNRNPAWHWATP